jgi:hypothetical protein
MKNTLILILTVASCAFAQDSVQIRPYQTAGPVTIAMASVPGTPVQGAPYTATINTQSIKTLGDGNQITQTSTMTTARDSQGRTRQDAPLPKIAKLPADAPHLVFIQDPVAHSSYTLNLTDKTAQKIPFLSPRAGDSGAVGGSGGFSLQMETAPSAGAAMAVGTTAVSIASSQSQASTEDLGSQTMEGLLVNGLRTTHTIPSGQIGNANPIKIVTEVWTSPDLQTIVYSKRSDPLMGDQTLQLTNIVRAEPDPSLFVIPADFHVDSPEVVVTHAIE